MLPPRTGLTTTQNTTQTPTTRLIAALMQAYGIGLAHEPSLLVKPLTHGFSLSQIFPFYFLTLLTFSSILFYHILDVGAKVCRSLETYHGQTVIALAHSYRQTTNNVDRELTELP